jgi:hypothetical protein
LPSAKDILDGLLFAVLVPSLLAAALMAAGSWLAGPRKVALVAGSAVAFIAAFLFGNWLRDGLPLTPGTASWTWLSWATVAAVAAGVVARLPAVPSGLGWALRATAANQVAWLLTPNPLREGIPWVPLLLAVVVLAEWALLEYLAGLETGGLVLLALVPVAFVSAVVLIQSGIARFGEAATVLMASLLGVGAVALAMQRDGSAVVPGAVVVLVGLLFAGHYNATTELPKAGFALAALSPLALAPSLLPAWRRHQKKGLWLVQAILLLAPLAGAFLLAAKVEMPDSEWD